MRHARLSCGWLFGAMLAGTALPAAAHSGPPYPIISNQRVGPYTLSVWTDPDTTDDGSPGGKFWVTFDAGSDASRGATVRVSIRPLDRETATLAGVAAPLRDDPLDHYVELVMDHEGPYGVQVAVDGPHGHVEVASRVDATYDLRPAPLLLALYLLPFALIGALWLKLLLRRRRARVRVPPDTPPDYQRKL